MEYTHINTQTRFERVTDTLSNCKDEAVSPLLGEVNTRIQHHEVLLNPIIGMVTPVAFDLTMEGSGTTPFLRPTFHIDMRQFWQLDIFELQAHYLRELHIASQYFLGGFSDRLCTVYQRGIKFQRDKMQALKLGISYSEQNPIISKTSDILKLLIPSHYLFSDVGFHDFQQAINALMGSLEFPVLKRPDPSFFTEIGIRRDVFIKTRRLYLQEVHLELTSRTPQRQYDRIDPDKKALLVANALLTKQLQINDLLSRYPVIIKILKDNVSRVLDL